MSEKRDLLSRLVIGRKRDGRREYDDAARDELVQLCLQPGVSVAETQASSRVLSNIRTKTDKYRKPDVQSGDDDCLFLAALRQSGTMRMEAREGRVVARWRYSSRHGNGGVDLGPR
jgi:transposase